jgi:hypothetical protein
VGGSLRAPWSGASVAQNPHSCIRICNYRGAATRSQAVTKPTRYRSMPTPP